MLSLQTIETWMLHAITHPDGIRAEGQASSMDDVSLTPDRVVHSTPEWSCEERLAIYWNAYYLRLQACLREDFPALCAALGDELFDGFVVDYLQAFPPSSDTLADLGTHLSDYLRMSRPVADPDRAENGVGPDWADFLVDLAHLERTISEVFDGAGSEGMPPFDAATLSRHAPSGIADAQVHLTPSLHIRSYRFPVHEFQTAARRPSPMRPPGEVPIPSPRETWLAVVRKEFRVQCFELDRLESALLTALQNGFSLAEACHTAAVDEASQSLLASRIEFWFQRWTRLGWIDEVAFLETTAA